MKRYGHEKQLKIAISQASAAVGADERGLVERDLAATRRSLAERDALVLELRQVNHL